MSRFGTAAVLSLLSIAVFSARSENLSRQPGTFDSARGAIEERIRLSGAETVAVAVYDLETRRSLLINENVEMHAASTMKVPVMMEVFRLASVAKLALNDQVIIKNSFNSVVDGTAYQLSVADDSAADLYGRQGESAQIRELLELMITRSSNLATNILIERVGPAEVTALVRRLGGKVMTVRRGVEDGKAFRAGINNTTTALDLMVLFRALAEGTFLERVRCQEMIDILLRQEFNEALTAGLPAGVRIAHKTGSITRIKHDAGIVLPHDRKPYVIVVLTRGIEDEKKSNALIADISRTVYEALVKPRAGK